MQKVAKNTGFLILGVVLIQNPYIVKTNKVTLVF